MVEQYDWSNQRELMDAVRSFVMQESLFWRKTGTGLLRHDRPEELRSLSKMISMAFHASIHDWWVMKQEGGAPGALPHFHNHWDTYIYYPTSSDRAISGEGWVIFPSAGEVVYLPVGTIHGVDDCEEEDGATRYSCVFLAYPKEYAFISSGEETQGQET